MLETASLAASRVGDALLVAEPRGVGMAVADAEVHTKEAAVVVAVEVDGTRSTLLVVAVVDASHDAELVVEQTSQVATGVVAAVADSSTKQLVRQQ